MAILLLIGCFARCAAGAAPTQALASRPTANAAHASHSSSPSLRSPAASTLNYFPPTIQLQAPLPSASDLIQPLNPRPRPPEELRAAQDAREAELLACALRNCRDFDRALRRAADATINEGPLIIGGYQARENRVAAEAARLRALIEDRERAVLAERARAPRPP